MLTVVAYIALLIAPDGHVTEVRDLPTPRACVAVVRAYKQEVAGGKGTCISIEP
jgi:hypothetical protein